MAPITAPTNSFCRSGLAENCANVLFWACCCKVSLSSSRSRTAQTAGGVMQDAVTWAGRRSDSPFIGAVTCLA